MLHAARGAAFERVVALRRLGSSDAIHATVFEDQDGAPISFADFFVGQPSIVAFFYTRCDNPQKCSLTVSKLATVQRQLAERGVADRVRTAAITYDPGFDVPARLRAYGHGRSMRIDSGHRLLRAPGGIEPLRRHFRLGVNFVESLVNRHRIEIYIVHTAGRIAASFGRIHWDEQEVVRRAIELLNEVEPRVADEARTGSTRSTSDAHAGARHSCRPCRRDPAEVPRLLGRISERPGNRRARTGFAYLDAAVAFGDDARQSFERWMA